jgi:hypothetical protein
MEQYTLWKWHEKRNEEYPSNAGINMVVPNERIDESGGENVESFFS